jgi:exonuclease III
VKEFNKTIQDLKTEIETLKKTQRKTTLEININGLNSPIKRHRLTDCICKQDPAFCCIQEPHISVKDRYYLRVKGWKTIFQANGPKK